MLRAVVDTNVWVSALLNPKGYPARVLDAFRLRSFTAVISQPLVDEIFDVLSRPRIARKYRLTPDEVAAYVGLIVERSELVNPEGGVSLCRDPRDDIVLETAILGSADCLVTRDDDIKGDEDLVDAMQMKESRWSPFRAFS